jgi:hypothetical protein
MVRYIRYNNTEVILQFSSLNADREMKITQLGQDGYDGLFKRAHSVVKRSDARVHKFLRVGALAGGCGSYLHLVRIMGLQND